MKVGQNYAILYQPVEDQEEVEYPVDVPWTYMTMEAFCSGPSNYFETECIRAWYYVVDNDMVLAWLIVIGQWLWAQVALAFFGWNVLPWICSMLGWLYFFVPVWAPHIDSTPYTDYGIYYVSFVVWVANLYKWDFFMFINFWTFSSTPMSYVDIIFWSWPWPAFYFWYESLWIALWGTWFSWFWLFLAAWIYVFYWPM